MHERAQNDTGDAIQGLDSVIGDADELHLAGLGDEIRRDLVVAKVEEDKRKSKELLVSLCMLLIGGRFGHHAAGDQTAFHFRYKCVVPLDLSAKLFSLIKWSCIVEFEFML